MTYLGTMPYKLSRPVVCSFSNRDLTSILTYTVVLLHTTTLCALRVQKYANSIIVHICLVGGMGDHCGMTRRQGS